MWSRVGSNGLPCTKMRPSVALALAGQHLDQLRLAVAGDAGDADDLAGMDLEVHRLDRRQALVVVGEQAGELRAPPAAAAHRLARRALADLGVADHHAAHLVDAEVGDLAAADLPAVAQHGQLVGEGGHLAELVGDHQDGEVAGLGHAAQQAEHLVGLARRQHRGRLVEDQEVLVEIELLEDFELLLLAGRQARRPARRAAP